MVGFLKTMLASEAHGTKKRMAQPSGTECGPRMPKGSAFCPARRELARRSKSDCAGCGAAAGAAGESSGFGRTGGFSRRENNHGKCASAASVWEASLVAGKREIV